MSAEEDIRRVASGKSGQVRSTCPFCSHARKNRTEQCLSIAVETDKLRYQCWHCEAVGVIDLDDQPRRRKPLALSKPPVALSKITQVSGSLSEASLEFLQTRGISKQTAENAGVFSTRKFFRKLGREAECLAFPYAKDGEVVGIKYRCLETKDFSWDGRASGLWGISQVQLELFGVKHPIIIVEGEMDRLACLEAGVLNVTSAPNGAPKKIKEGRVSPEEDRLFRYVWEDREHLDAAERVIIASDGDEAGEALGEELARRVGKGKSFKVLYPKDCKDSNDVLLKHGKQALQDMFDEAQPWPVAGLFHASHYNEMVNELYTSGPGKGLSTGIDSLDKLFTISQGQLSVVTGTPGSGKSELIDQIMFNLAKENAWKFAICSFENPPPYHIVKFAEKFTSKPFFEGPQPRQRPDEVIAAKKFIQEHFVFMDWGDGEPSTIDTILDRAKSAVQRLGVRGVVIDPYNYIQIDKKTDSETNLISDMLTKVRQFAIAHDCHVWFVAHPQKLQRSQNGSLPVPKGFDISGSAAFFSKADIGWTAVRPELHVPKDQREENAPPTADVHCWKVRFKWIGTVGEVSLNYKPLTGQYSKQTDWEEVDEAAPKKKSWKEASPLQLVVKKHFLD